MWKDCQPFRMPPSGSHVRYIMVVMNLIICADLTGSCSTLRPQAYENNYPTFIFIPAAHFLFLSELPVCKRESMHSGATQRYFVVLPELLPRQILNMDHSLRTSHCCGQRYLASIIYITNSVVNALGPKYKYKGDK